jgi:hypothetical protein
VFIAFLETDIANFRTNQRHSFSPVRFACQLTFGVGADTRAYQIKFNTPSHLHPGFAQTLYGAALAGFETILAGLDAVVDVRLKHEKIYLKYQELMRMN